MTNPQSANSRIAKNTLFLYVRMGVVLAITLFTTRIVLRVLGVEDFGIYNVVCGLVSIFTILNTTLTGGINRYYNIEIGKGEDGKVNQIFNAALRAQVLLAAGVIILAESIGLWYLNNVMVIPTERIATANVIFQLSILMLALNIIQTPFSAAIMAYEKMDYYALVSIVHVSLKFVCVVLLQFIDADKLLYYGLIMLFTTVVDFLLYFIYCRIHFATLRLEKSTDAGSVKSLVNFSVWMMLDPLGYTARGQGSNMVLNSFFGPTVNAAYGVAEQVGTAVSEFTNAISTAFKPQLIQSHSSGNSTRALNLMFSMSKINFVLCLMICAPLICSVEFILGLWLGEYPALAPAFVCLFLADKVIYTLNTPVSTMLMAIGKIKKYMSGICIMNVMLIPTGIVLFKFGCSPVSLFVTMLGLSLVIQTYSILILNYENPEFSIARYCKTVVLPLLAHLALVGAAMWGVTKVLDPGIWRFAAACVCSLCVGVISGYLLVFSESEKKICTELSARLLFWRNKK